MAPSTFNKNSTKTQVETPMAASSMWSCVLKPLTLITAMLVCVGLWFFWHTSNGLPFSDLRWDRGRLIVQVGEQWHELCAISGIRMDTLTDIAISEWGPSYQDRFADALPSLMERAGGRIGIRPSLDMGPRDSTFRKRVFSTRRNRAKCLAAIAGRQRIPIDLEGAIDRSVSRDRLRLVFGDDDGFRLTGADAMTDLETLHWLLVHRYSRPERTATAFERLRVLAGMVSNGISRPDLALQIQWVLGALEDIHARVSFGRSGIYLPEKERLSSFKRVQSRFLALTPDGGKLLDRDYPIVERIGGIHIDSLRTLAETLGGNTSRWLSRVDLMLMLAGRDYLDARHLIVSSPDGRTKSLLIKATRPMPEGDLQWRVEGRILGNGIGHLALRRGLYDDSEYEKEIIRAMYDLRYTPALIVDLRGNGGGKRTIVPLLLKIFIRPDAHPHVYNTAVYRMDLVKRPPAAAEVLRGRALFSTIWQGWDELQRARIAATTWVDETEAFSSIHLALTDLSTPDGVKYHEGPVIVLIDEDTASAAELLLSNLRGQAAVMVMGVPSAGGSGFAQPYRLPHSGIEIEIPSMRSFSPDGRLIGNTVPDVVLSPRLDDVLAEFDSGRDLLLDRAIGILDNPDSLSAYGLRHVRPGYAEELE